MDLICSIAMELENSESYPSAVLDTWIIFCLQKIKYSGISQPMRCCNVYQMLGFYCGSYCVSQFADWYSLNSTIKLDL